MIKLNTRISRVEGAGETTKSPAVLAGEHPYTRLYIAWTHVKMHHGGVETVSERATAAHLGLRPDRARSVRAWRTTRGRSPSRGWTPLRPALGHRGPPTPQTIRGPIHVFDHASRSSRARGVPLHGRSDTHSQGLHGAPRVSDGDLERQGHQLRGGGQRAGEERRYGRSRGSIRAPGPLAIHTAGRTIHGEPGERMVQSVKRASPPFFRSSIRGKRCCRRCWPRRSSRSTVGRSPTCPCPPRIRRRSPEPLSAGRRGAGTNTGRVRRGRSQQSTAVASCSAVGGPLLAALALEYLPPLQRRHSSQQKGTPPEVDDMVLIVDENLPRNTWPRGRVLELYPEGWRGTSGGAADGCRALKRPEEDRRPPEMKCKNCTAGECCGRQCIVIK
ncbi:hypothetical protein EVAR_90405_1 [Eumeta japonica]|uniref:DUF5641 domain-containing protein n=1 Tax=Eumeta variegata TaxID=151549 RepID=A0A4C1YCC2_EUMVA|nr:hypothetical protein EVAR_90405_1 [Eumeta japonica]